MLEGKLSVGTLKIHKPIQLNNVSADTNIIKPVIYGRPTLNCNGYSQHILGERKLSTYFKQ